MNIGVIGVNFRSADLNFREKLAQKVHQFSKFTSLQKIYRVFLSTCNRFEIYFSAEDSSEAHSHLIESLRQELKEDCGFKLYAYFGKECFYHLCRVTSGLDSAILAETEIQGQVKRAYMGSPKEMLNSELHFLFQKSLKIGKSIRTQIPIRFGVPTLTGTLKKMLESLAEFKSKPDILFVGTSFMNQKVIKSLKKDQMNLYVSSRSEKRLHEFSHQNQMIPFGWNELENWQKFDGIVLASNCPSTLIAPKPNLSPKYRIILDLSVPRNACPKLNAIDKLQLWNIDQLNKVVRKHRKVKANELLKVDFQVQRAVFTQWSLFKHRKLCAQKIKSVI